MYFGSFLKIICCVSSSIVWFYLCSRIIKKGERFASSFYLPLRDGHPKEYLKQPKLIKRLRKYFKLSTYDKLHWVYIVLHYLQIVILCTAALPVILPLFYSIDFTIVVYIITFIVVLFIFRAIETIFELVQSIRCDKIKKTNPEYAKCKLKDWRGIL